MTMHTLAVSLMALTRLLFILEKGTFLIRQKISA